MKQWVWIFIGISGFTAVLMGAAAAHWLASTMHMADIARIEKASSYQMYHTLALLGVVIAHQKKIDTNWSMMGFMLGIVLFSGSLYVYSFSHITLFMYLTPLGGLTWMVAWLSLIRYGYQKLHA